MIASPREVSSCLCIIYLTVSETPIIDVLIMVSVEARKKCHNPLFRPLIDRGMPQLPVRSVVPHGC